MIDLEMIFGARARSVPEMASARRIMQTAPITPEVLERSMDVIAGLASRGTHRGVKPADLITIGTSTYRAPDRLSPQDADDVIVTQGFQEGSNVNIVNELVNLITVSRMYESNFKSISKYDDRLGELMKVIA